jgi:hypothetical protein
MSTKVMSTEIMSTDKRLLFAGVSVLKPEPFLKLKGLSCAL